MQEKTRTRIVVFQCLNENSLNVILNERREWRIYNHRLTVKS